jgi:3-oxoacyl-[acyl-carrier-protein] synthase-3
MSRKAKIIGIGSYLPEKTVSNDDLSKILDTSDEWITSRSGIKQRHQAGEGEYDQLISACKRRARRCAMPGLTIDDIDLIVWPPPRQI